MTFLQWASGDAVGAVINRPGDSAPAGAVSTGDAPPIASSQSPLSSVSACGENCARSLAPPFPTARGAAGAPFRSCPKRECAAPGGREKGAKRAPVQLPSARDGGRRIGASVDFGPPSGTLGSSAIPRLPSRGGWCGGRRGARTHLTSFSFRAFRFATRCPGGHGGVYHTGPKAFRVPVGADAFIGPPVQASAAARRPGDRGGLPTARLGASPGPAGGGDRTHKRTIWRSRPGRRDGPCSGRGAAGAGTPLRTGWSRRRAPSRW